MFVSGRGDPGPGGATDNDAGRGASPVLTIMMETLRERWMTALDDHEYAKYAEYEAFEYAEYA